MTVASYETDSALLREFIDHRAPEVFGELVSRNADWIYAAAVRLVRDKELAEDISQAVFLLLWQRAQSIRGEALNGWLFNVTRYCASNALRTMQRRKKHERSAAMMTSEVAVQGPQDSWEEVAPVLDRLVATLRRKDRKVVLLRFYRRKTMREISLVLGISEEAARKRVSAAVKNLRLRVSREGISVSAPVLETALLSSVSRSAPPSLLQFKAADASRVAINIVKGTKTMILMTKLKIAAMIAGIILLPVGAGVYLLAGFLSGVAPPPPTTRADAATPAPIASTEPTDVSTADAGVIPFLNSNTGMLIAFDLETLDLTATRARIAGIKSAQPAATGRAQRMADQLTAFAQKLRQNGAKRIYMMLVLHGSAQQNPVVIVPVAPGADSTALGRLFGTDPSSTAVLHDAVVCNSDIKQIRTTAAEPRMDLVDALSAGAAPMRVLYVPSNFRNQHVPADLVNFGVSPSLYSEAQWSEVKWCLLEIAPDPQGSPHIIYQCQNHDSAQALAEFLRQKIDLPDSLTRPGSAASFFRIFRGGQIRIEGNRVEIKLDPGEVDGVVLTPIFRGKGSAQ
jgi:RNA polymerase sigma factor (sigma-70 family)